MQPTLRTLQTVPFSNYVSCDSMEIDDFSDEDSQKTLPSNKTKRDGKISDTKNTKKKITLDSFKA